MRASPGILENVRSRMVIVAWVVACLIWSTVWLAIKVGVSGAPPLGFATLRLALALTVVLPLAHARQRLASLSSRDIRLMAETGALLLGANYAFVYWGSQYISSGLTATLQAMTPVFGIIVARVLTPEERTTWAQTGALCLGVLGVAFVFWPDLVLSRVDGIRTNDRRPMCGDSAAPRQGLSDVARRSRVACWIISPRTAAIENQWVGVE